MTHDNKFDRWTDILPGDFYLNVNNMCQYMAISSIKNDKPYLIWSAIRIIDSKLEIITEKLLQPHSLTFNWVVIRDGKQVFPKTKIGR